MKTPPSAPIWLRRAGIVNDYVRIPYANGSSFASQLLHRQLTSHGVDVTIVGPRARKHVLGTDPPKHISLRSAPMHNHPGVFLALPKRADLDALRRADFDLVLSHSCTGCQYAGVWLSQMHDVPLVSVNTVHLPSVYNTQLPDALLESPTMNRLFSDVLVPWAESHTVDVYNESDVLITLSEGMADYWRGLGVTTPIAVVGRSIDTQIFDSTQRPDPFDARAPRGGRLLVACRHVREKGLDPLLRTFARHLAPVRPELTLTLIGDGPDHDTFRELAAKLGVVDKCFFVRERPRTEMPQWYQHADAFVYMSMSETYGQVVGEALWCGLPVVAYDDGRGVRSQVTDGVDGVLVSAPAGRPGEDPAFAAALIQLFDEPDRRRALGEEAKARTRQRAEPDHILNRVFEVFEQAREHRFRRTRRSPVVRAQTGLFTLARWWSIHGAVYATGLLRPPSRVNRDATMTPAWSGTHSSAATEVLPTIHRR